MKKMRSIKIKLLLAFTVMITFLIVLFSTLFYKMKWYSINQVYQHFEVQAEYYMSPLEYRLEQMLRGNAEIFRGRQLVFLADERSLDDYEKREALLSVQEDLNVLKMSDSLIKEVTLYIPASNRVITTTAFLPLDEEKRDELSNVISTLQQINALNGDLLYSLSEAPYSQIFPPHFYTKLVIDRNQIVKSLNDFVLDEGGICWYNEKLDWFVEDSKGLGISQRILEKIDADASVQRIKIDNKTYLVNVTKSEYFGLLVQYCSEKSVLNDLENYTLIFVLFIFLTLVCALLFSNYTEILVNRPLKKMYVAFKDLKKGDMSVRIEHSSQDEFKYIYTGFNDMVSELDNTIKEVYIQKQFAAQAELKQLQAQINPHFLYNTFFLFSGRIRKKDYEGARGLAEYLGTYFLYLTRNGADALCLKDEYSHAESYVRIQECRFDPRIKVVWEPLPIEVENIMVPRLIIQPILENAYKYGLEEMEENGFLHVWSEIKDEMFNIYIENNGNISDEDIDMIRKKLSDEYEGEATGLINIHKRLRGFCGAGSGIQVKRGELGGIITILSIALDRK